MTAQVMDRIKYRGKTYRLCSEPLEYLFDKIHRSPFMALNTGCYRGYVAKWEIKNNDLFLVGLIESSIPDSLVALLLGFEMSANRTFCQTFLHKGIEYSKYTYSMNARNPISATWFSGQLSLQRGKLLQYVHMGYNSVYEQEAILTVEKGKVVAAKFIDRRESVLPQREKMS